ncbi:MAG: tol-pal system-associated acyl-CoA thioesterase [Alphaproteobacteria bacterium]|nr:tol-pal system-associated acyl-CoA thioesterase [Alphaproteobacteria bacterium]
MTERALFQVRVYFEDTDFSGHVYHAAYLKFFERARTEWLRQKGVQHSGLIADGLFFAARRMQIDWLKPAHIDDLVEIETRIVKATGARLTLAQEMRRGDDLLVTASIEIVMVNAAGRPVRLPKQLF